MSTTRRRWASGTPLNRSIWARISMADLPLRSSSPGFGSASDIGQKGPTRLPKTQKATSEVACHGSREELLADLEDERQRDDERVNDERLDQGEAENHRAADLTGGAGVAGDAVEGGGCGAALADATTERGDADAEAGGHRDHAEVVREALGLDRRVRALREGERRETEDDEDGSQRGQDLDGP